jgi:hypothetical protein
LPRWPGIAPLPDVPGRVRPWHLFLQQMPPASSNAAEPTIGRRAIAEDMGAFFVEFPDLVLHMDDLRFAGNQAIYLWTLQGTHSESGNFVRIPG